MLCYASASTPKCQLCTDGARVHARVLGVACGWFSLTSSTTPAVQQTEYLCSSLKGGHCSELIGVCFRDSILQLFSHRVAVSSRCVSRRARGRAVSSEISTDTMTTLLKSKSQREELVHALVDLDAINTACPAGSCSLA